jgi:hypothetical protein
MRANGRIEAANSGKNIDCSAISARRMELSVSMSSRDHAGRSNFAGSRETVMRPRLKA